MMTIINEFQAGLHTEQAHEYCDLLWHLAKADKSGGVPSLVSDRCVSVETLCEAHFEQFGKMPDSNVLDRLASLILFDDLTDDTPWKTQNTEYPIESERQELDYHKGLTARAVPESISTDGKDYRMPTRRIRTPSENAHMDREYEGRKPVDAKRSKKK